MSANKSYMNSIMDKRQSGNHYSTQCKIDFISRMGEPAMFPPVANKVEILKTLDEFITKPVQEMLSYIEAYNLLFHTASLTNAEKITWITNNNSKLPPPFLLLNAVLISQDINNLKKAGAWYNFALLRIEMDADKCVDESSKAGIGMVLAYLLPRFNIGIPKTDPNVCGKVLLQLALDTRDEGLKLHHENPRPVTEPYWISNHGMRLILIEGGTSADDGGPFIPKSEWEKIEKECIERFIKQKVDMQKQIEIFSKQTASASNTASAASAASATKLANAANPANTASATSSNAASNTKSSAEVTSSSNLTESLIPAPTLSPELIAFFESHHYDVKRINSEIEVGTNSSNTQRFLGYLYRIEINKGKPAIKITNINSRDPGKISIGVCGPADSNYIMGVTEIEKTASHDFAVESFEQGDGNSPSIIEVGVYRTPDSSYDNGPGLNANLVRNGLTRKTTSMHVNCRPDNLWLIPDAIIRECHTPEPVATASAAAAANSTSNSAANTDTSNDPKKSGNNNKKAF